MFEQFTKEQVRILKKICENPIFKQTKPVQLVVKNKNLKDLRLDICNHYDITEDIFLSSRKDAILIQARKEFVHNAVKIRRVCTQRIAEAMNKDRQMVCYYLRKPSPETDALLQTFNDSNE
ncbi:MAG: hypothetical protein CML39_03110 [Rhodobacteraceae bacterium]|nr:MAG: hypothetical protein CML39_03110 [Paracoccaceae bacterium]|tara:strand:+ start:1736 stop:2098 length:363 start_codon:yes stop_codon:yes gene_type:complete